VSELHQVGVARRAEQPAGAGQGARREPRHRRGQVGELDLAGGVAALLRSRCLRPNPPIRPGKPPGRPRRRNAWGRTFRRSPRAVRRRTMRAMVVGLAWAAGALALADEPQPARSKTDPPGAPLEARLVVKKAEYVLDRGGLSADEFKKAAAKEPPRVDVDLVL